MTTTCVKHILPDDAARDVPLYSTDIASAWLVVEEMRGRSQFYVTVGTSSAQSLKSVPRVEQEWSCVIGINDGRYGPVAVAQAATAPLAICLAALEALGAHPLGNSSSGASGTTG